MQASELEPAAPARGAKRSAAHWLVLAADAAGVLALVVLRYAVHPDPRGYGTHEQLGLPACASMELFGLPCPGCGVTTATAWAVHGELARALAVQPFALVALAALALLLGWSAWQLAHGRDLGPELARTRKKPWIVLGAVLLAGCWVYKLVATFAA